MSTGTAIAAILNGSTLAAGDRTLWREYLASAPEALQQIFVYTFNIEPSLLPDVTEQFKKKLAARENPDALAGDAEFLLDMSLKEDEYDAKNP